MTRTYEQGGIDGGATVTAIRPWKKDELRTPKMRSAGGLARLVKAETRMLRGRDAAGGWDPYFESGGMAGPFGNIKAPKVAPIEAPIETPLARVVDIDTRLEQGEAEIRTWQERYGYAQCSRCHGETAKTDLSGGICGTCAGADGPLEQESAPATDAGWTYTVTPADGGRCSGKGCEEGAQWWTSCEDLSGTYRATRRRTCGEHAARFCDRRGIPLPAMAG